MAKFIKKSILGVHIEPGVKKILLFLGLFIIYGLHQFLDHSIFFAEIPIQDSGLNIAYEIRKEY